MFSFLLVVSDLTLRILVGITIPTDFDDVRFGGVPILPEYYPNELDLLLVGRSDVLYNIIIGGNQIRRCVIKSHLNRN